MRNFVSKKWYNLRKESKERRGEKKKNGTGMSERKKGR